VELALVMKMICHYLPLVLSSKNTLVPLFFFKNRETDHFLLLKCLPLPFVCAEDGNVTNVEVVASFFNGEKVKVGEIEYTINPVLTCDLKALMKMLAAMGLCNVYHPCSTWQCPYCEVKSWYK